MKSIAIFYHGGLAEQTGGVARVSVWLARRLMAANYKVCAITLRGCDSLSDPSCRTFLVDDARKVAAAQVKKIVKDEHIDLIVNQSSFFSAAQILSDAGCKIITVAHNNPAPLRIGFSPKRPMGNWKGKLGAYAYNMCPRLMNAVFTIHRYFLTKKVIRFSNCVCVLSPAYERYYERFVRKALKPVKSIGNPIPFNIPDGETSREKIVLYVGRLTYVEKRIDWLLRIWEEASPAHPDWKLIIVGDGVERERLATYVAEHRLRVEFVGQCNPRQYYQKASLICLVSPSEGFPLVLPEAMSFGVVPILFDSFGAAHDIIEDGVCGALVKPFDFKSYALRLGELMNEDLTQKGCSARKKALLYSGDLIFHLWKELIDETLLH